MLAEIVVFAFRLITRGWGNSASYDKRGFKTQVMEAKHETCEASAVSRAEIVVFALRSSYTK